MNPIRHALLWLAAKPAVGSWLERSPLCERLIRRFVAGPTSAQALAAAAPLVAQGYGVTFSYLGEDVATEAEAEEAVEEYLALIAAVGAAGVAKRTKIAVKPSLIGLQLAPAAALRNLERILAAAAEHEMTVELDMERSASVDSTLTLYRAARAHHATLGVALQASLRRTEADLQTLLDEQIANVRLVKGAYDEPASVAYRSRAAIERAYQRLLRAMLSSQGTAAGAFTAVATHDLRLIATARTLSFRQRIAPDHWEVQMLYGVRRPLQERLRREGYPMRVYLPYGERWYPYFVRRLAERPANLWFALRQLLP